MVDFWCWRSKKRSSSCYGKVVSTIIHSSALHSQNSRLIEFRFSDVTAAKHDQQSIVIVPSNAKGVKLVRPLSVVCSPLVWNESISDSYFLLSSLVSMMHQKVTTRSSTTMFEFQKAISLVDGDEDLRSFKVD